MAAGEGNKREGMVTPEPIMRMATGFFASQTLFAALRVDAFSTLDANPLDAAAAATVMGIPERSAELLLNACAALDLVHKERGLYRNSPMAAQFLVKGKPTYIGGSLGHFSDQLYPAWGNLPKVVQSGRPFRETFDRERRPSEAEMRTFIDAMHANSSITAPFLAALVDLGDCRKLLDIGGGSGANAMALVAKNPSLQVTVYDFEAVCRIAEGYVAEAGLSERVSTHAGDFNEQDLPRGYDCALLSQILHGEGPEACRALVRKVFDALDPPGRIIIVDMLMNEEKDGPQFSALFALNMLLHTAEGRTYTGSEVADFLTSAGFVDVSVKTMPPDGRSSAIIARKPG